MRTAARVFAVLECAVIILLGFCGSKYTYSALMGYATTALLSLWGFNQRYRPGEKA